jgi:hypothetical protein
MKTLILTIILQGCALFAAPTPQQQFNTLLKSGAIYPTEENDGRQMYFIIAGADTIETAYKGEILNYLQHGKFNFNEDLQD